MAQKQKRNHWVPQAYLRTFAADPDKREKIWRFSKNAGAPELKPIKNVAVRFYLYTPEDELGTRDYSFEAKLAELERWFAHPLWASICDDMVDLRREPLRKMVALLAAVLYLRHPTQLEDYMAMHQTLAGFLSAWPNLLTEVEHKGKVYKLDTSSWPAYRDAGLEDIKREWIKTVSNAARIAELFLRMRWAVIFSEAPLFITSDNPVSTLHPSLAFRGLNNPETSVMFPLSTLGS